MIFKSLATVATEALGLTNNAAAAVQFWIYDTLLITTLLITIMFAVAYLRTYYPPHKIRDFLQEKHALTRYGMASLLGIISPFCSCSTIPIFLGLVGAGVPFGITMTFLAVSPMINEAALLILPSVLGFKLTALYMVSGVTVGITGGYLLDRLGFEQYIKEFEWNEATRHHETPTQQERVKQAYHESFTLVKEILPYVLLGVAVGAIIHGYLPQSFISKYLSGSLGVVGAVIIGVPIYTNIVGVIPVVESLIAKGLPIGTSIAFMMSVAALSLPQFLILNKVMKKELIAAFAFIVAFGILAIGFAFNVLL